MAEGSGRYVVGEAHNWNSRDGFDYEKCKHRTQGACLRCRLRWFVHLWRNGNRIRYLP